MVWGATAAQARGLGGRQEETGDQSPLFVVQATSLSGELEARRRALDKSESERQSALTRCTPLIITIIKGIIGFYSVNFIKRLQQSDGVWLSVFFIQEVVGVYKRCLFGLWR